jgi:hypothetical protein
MLMLDEVRNVLAGSAKEQRILLNTLPFLSNELKLSLVCLGISEAREAISGDIQLRQAVPRQHIAGSWSDNPAEDAGYTDRTEPQRSSRHETPSRSLKESHSAALRRIPRRGWAVRHLGHYRAAHTATEAKPASPMALAIDRQR